MKKIKTKRRGGNKKPWPLRMLRPEFYYLKSEKFLTVAGLVLSRAY